MKESRRSAALVALCGVQFIDVLGVTSAVAAIPSMLRGVQAPPAAAPVVASAYATLFGGLLVLGARLGDRFGHRRVLIVGIAVFAVAGVAGGTGQDVLQLIGARALQGAAAAVGVPCALRLLLALPERRPGGSGPLAAWSASGATAGALGFLVGGVLAGGLGWRAVFWLNPPVALALLVAVLLAVRPLPPDPSTRLDLGGAALLVVAISAVTSGAALLEQPASRTAGGLTIAIGALTVAAFVAWQRIARHPLIPNGALASAGLRGGVLVSSVNTGTTSSAGVLATLLLQDRLDLPPQIAGLLLLPFSLGAVAGSVAAAPIGRRMSGRAMAATGLAAIGAGDLVLALTVGTLPGVVAGTVVAGLGLGVASVAGNRIGTAVPERLQGAAVGLLNTGAQLGTAVGVAGLVVLAEVIGGPAGTASAWAVAALTAALTAALLVRSRFQPESGRAAAGSSGPP